MDSPPATILLTSSSLLILLLLHFSQTSQATNPHCTPSACGIIPNISSPFRLRGHPKHCGYRFFELACENNVTFLYLNSQKKYYVKAINYDNSTIRLVDASINNDDICSFPNYSTYAYNFTYSSYNYPYLAWRYSSYPYDYIAFPINFMSCTNPLKNSSLLTEITGCAFNSSHPTRYDYIKVGRMNASELPQTCELYLIAMTSWKFKDSNNVSLSEIHQSLLYGFELTVSPQGITDGDLALIFYGLLVPTLAVIVGLLCAVVSPPIMTIFGFGAVSILIYYIVMISLNMTYDHIFFSLRSVLVLIIGLLCAVVSPLIMTIFGFAAVSILIYYIVMLSLDMTHDHIVFTLAPLVHIIDFIFLAPRIIIFPFTLWFLIYKFRRRHFSMYNTIECFLRSDNKLAPIRYSYSDIKRMTRGFQDKLGEGGYACVYKGKLRSGHHVAVKMLGKSGGNGQDFMNEIATIGRIHHVNVVKLVGYCAQGSKRALVYDFMPNGSLEKYIFNREKLNSLDWDKKFQIIVGVARGIEYLHQGCDVQILHFDIKPHNILLDDKFVPKISDFGLAKFCSTDKKTVTMTAARGTIGYVAPELISRSIGAVSYKADVYSFGMMLMEIVGLKRDLKGNHGDSSRYFPYWIYDYFEQGKDIEIGRADENDNDSMTKLVRKMTIVALWCIQMCPDDRPSMSKVLEMLEADVERLKIPDYPSQSTQIVVNEYETGITCSTDSASLLHHHDVSSSVEITVQE